MMKFPTIPHYSELPNLNAFVGQPLVFTEKLDGLNVRLFDGQAYTRDDSGTPHDAGYMALVKKWHAHKTAGSRGSLFGEDLYARHACKYGPIDEKETWRLFAITLSNNKPFVINWGETEMVGAWYEFLSVPVLLQARFDNVAGLETAIDTTLEGPSCLGGEKEGLVVRTWDAFDLAEASRYMFKVVRPGHVQPDADHWRKRWQPREIIWRGAE